MNVQPIHSCEILRKGQKNLPWKDLLSQLNQQDFSLGLPCTRCDSVFWSFHTLPFEYITIASTQKAKPVVECSAASRSVSQEEPWCQNTFSLSSSCFQLSPRCKTPHLFFSLSCRGKMINVHHWNWSSGWRIRALVSIVMVSVLRAIEPFISSAEPDR